jgi:hypothetical protein
MNLIKIIKFLKRNLKTILIFIGLKYQAIDLTIEYLKYETLFKIEYDTNRSNIPAVSLCATTKKQLNKKYANA